jgi:alpha-beta hydrolase superfamily lysophospholipase
MTTSSFFQTMADGTGVSVNRWIPDGAIKGIVQLSHGMAEHAMRYDRFGSILAENGFLFSAHDHRGHGKTAQKAETDGTGMFGYLADRDGFNRVGEDLSEVIDRVKKDYPEKKIILFGHSFGSFISQWYIEKYGSTIDGCILSGTSGSQPMLACSGFLLSTVIRIFCGRRHRSSLLNNLTFGSYNKRIDIRKYEHDWLSRDMASVAMYESDKWCGFIPTTSFFHDLSKGLFHIYTARNIRKIPRNLPVLFLCGEGDPVGKYGKSVEKLADRYKKSGMQDIVLKEYPGARHELLNETNRDEVIGDILLWMTPHID